MAHPLPQGPTGPVESERLALDLAQVRVAWASQVQERWLPVVKMLCRELDNVTSVVLCTSAGGAVATYGLASANVARSSNLTGVLFGSASALNDSELDSVHLSAGITTPSSPRSRSPRWAPTSSRSPPRVPTSQLP